MSVNVVKLYRYPVKGLSGQPLRQGVELSPGHEIPFDRAYAIENGPGKFDAANPRHLPKVAFLCLMRDERLAALETQFQADEGRHLLEVRRAGHVVTSGDLATPEGRSAIEAFFAREFASELRGPPRIVAAPGHSFSDVPEKCLHIINLASVRALEATLGQAIDPRRFRANVHIDGLPANAELDLVGRTLQLGAATLQVFKRTQRCAATNVDPVTAIRAGDLPGHLARTLGHSDFGIYATVTYGGHIAPGDELSVSTSG